MPKKIQTNSQKVETGDIFVAISCPNIENNIKDARQKGAGLIFAENKYKDIFDSKDIVYIDDARFFVSKMASFLHSGAPEMCVCVTGTNGKSSVVHFLMQIWKYCQKKSANLGTLGLFENNTANTSFPLNSQTTPDPITLHQILEYLANNQTTHFAFEASSHALVQKRLHSVSLCAAAFTNFSSDHLDYHKSIEEYFQAKLILFKDILGHNKPAVVSKDFPKIYDAVKKINNNTITFGFQKSNFIHASNIFECFNKTTFDITIGAQTFQNIETKLVGKFQIMNILCAISFAYLSNIPIEQIVESLPHLSQLSGRMEHICAHHNGNIYIDYAHTSDGLQHCLNIMNAIKKDGRVICVFGCGGDRDKGKRKEMGEIANNFSDLTIITDDNPRTEEPKTIRNEILSTCINGIEIANRKDAIKYAMDMMQANDVLAIVGKGHESTQIYKEQTIQHNDKDEILNNL